MFNLQGKDASKLAGNKQTCRTYVPHEEEWQPAKPLCFLFCYATVMPFISFTIYI